MTVFLYIMVGLFAGTVGGAFGLGGGAIMVPAFVLWFGLTQHQAQGTALAVMLPPVFIFGVLRYYSAGNVKVQMALFVAAGFIIGAFLGAHFIQGMPDTYVKKAFGAFMIIMGIKMVLMK